MQDLEGERQAGEVTNCSPFQEEEEKSAFHALLRQRPRLALN